MEIDYRKMQRQARLREMCGMEVYPWLRSLGEYARENAIYPLSLCDLYEEPRDKEIAAVIEALMPMSRRDSYVTEFRNMLGASLHDRIERRDFMQFATQDTILGALSLKTSQLFNILDWIWSVKVADKVSLEYAVLGELGYIRKYHKMPLVDAMDFSDQRFRLEMSLVKMTLRDGYGCGLWDYLEEDELPCPVNADIKRMLKSYYPIDPGATPQEMIEFIGIKKPVDTLYVYWGYTWAKKLHTKTIENLEKRLKRWVKSCEMRDLPVPKKLRLKQKKAPADDSAGAKGANRRAKNLNQN